MNDYKFETLIKMLSWNYENKDEQKKAISTLAENMDLIKIKKLIQPMKKEYWLNSSKVIKQIDKNIIEEASADLLVWLQDLNWPGALNILNAFEKMKFECFKQGFNMAIASAEKEYDDIWLENLKELKKRNYLYTAVKEIIENKYRDRNWENEYIRVDLFEQHDILEYTCKIYLTIKDCYIIELEFYGYTPFCKDNDLFGVGKDGDSFYVEINLLHLEVLEKLMGIIVQHYDVSSNYAWIKRKLIYSLDELHDVFKKYTSEFLRE